MSFAEQTPVFRSGVDLLTVEVQIVDRSGEPASLLQVGQFRAFIDGRERKVVAAQYQPVRRPASDPVVRPNTPIDPTSATATIQPSARIYVLAFDEYGLRPDTMLQTRRDAERFLDALDPEDWVGLYAFPNSRTVVNPSRDHEAVRQSLGKVTGRFTRPASVFSLIESEIILMNGGDPDTIRSVVARECEGRRMAGCTESAILAEARRLGGVYEALGTARLSALGALFDALASSSRLKTVVLITGDLASSVGMSSQPKLQTLTRSVGRRAAEANVSLYILRFDTILFEMKSARERRPREVPSWESPMFRAGHELVRAGSNGHLFHIQAGTSDYAFERIRRETSGFYLLGIEPQPEDRNGKPRTLKIEVATRGLIVRHDTRVVVPNATGR